MREFELRSSTYVSFRRSAIPIWDCLDLNFGNGREPRKTGWDSAPGDRAFLAMRILCENHDACPGTALRLAVNADSNLDPRESSPFPIHRAPGFV